MIYVVTYDISDDRIRADVARTLSGFGTRVQHSVFECRIDHRELSLMKKVLVAKLGVASAGDIRIYCVCADCLAHSEGIGDVVRAVDAESCIII